MQNTIVMADTSSVNISIVIPLLNEEESLSELMEWIHNSLSSDFTYEVLFIDDGSTDDSWQIIEELHKQYKDIVNGIRFQRNYGKSAALQIGFGRVKGDVVVTMDADLQDSPEEIPELYRMVTEEGYDLVSGWKKVRHDPLSKTIPTKIYNGFTGWMSGVKLHDMNCGLKAYKRRVVQSVELYGDMHRYIPVMAAQAGFDNIGEKVVKHQARKYGVSKFGLRRFINGPLDLLSVLFISKFRKKPMHFFGSWGLFFFFLGFVMFSWLIIDKALHLYVWEEPARLVTDNPLFFGAILAMILGSQLFLAGYLSELIARSSPDRNNYLIEEEL